MAARVVFVFLYGGFIEGHDRYLRPSHVYFFTEEQAGKSSDEERIAWLSICNKPGYRPDGERWYADTSRESIRDDLMRNQLLRLGIMQKIGGVSSTASTPINFITREFANLFDPTLSDEQFEAAAEAWRNKHLDQATQQRMALRAAGLQAKTSDVLIEMPDQTRIRISAGPSSDIAKGLIEDFTKWHMAQPAVLWLSASDKKAFPQFVEISASVGLKINVSSTLPDVILADLQDPIQFIFCEIVATDGAVTEARREELLAIIRASNIPEENVHFLTAFEDREAAPFKKNFSQLARRSMVWFRTEPYLRMHLNARDTPLSGANS